MSHYFKLFTHQELSNLLQVRLGEVKLGERVLIANKAQSIEQNIQKSEAEFVLLGIPEDIGVRANGGIGGTQSLWHPFLSALLHLQSTSIFRGSELLLLGHFDFSEWMFKSQHASLQELRATVSKIDNEVYPIIQSIVKAGKIPIVIGGGHNNAYPIIKGVALAKGGPINCINLDAHSDFRVEEGRHSGNGFRYACNEQWLNRYAIIGLHENYNSESVVQDLDDSDRVYYRYYEDIFIRQELDFKQAVYEAVHFTDSHPTGIELDLDCIENVLTSASTPAGLSTLDARRFVNWTADKSEVAYLHLTEAAIQLNNGRRDDSTAKLVAYLVSDFIKAYNG